MFLQARVAGCLDRKWLTAELFAPGMVSPEVSQQSRKKISLPTQSGGNQLSD